MHEAVLDRIEEVSPDFKTTLSSATELDKASQDRDRLNMSISHLVLTNINIILNC